MMRCDFGFMGEEGYGIPPGRRPLLIPLRDRNAGTDRVSGTHTVTSAIRQEWHERDRPVRASRDRTIVSCTAIVCHIWPTFLDLPRPTRALGKITCASQGPVKRPLTWTLLERATGLEP